MASKGSGAVTLRGRFSPGTKVALHERTGDFFHASAPVLDTGRVDKDGSVTFDGLEPGTRLWIATQEGGEPRSVAMTAKEQAQDKKPLAAAEVRKRLGQTRPAETSGAIVTGPRSTASGRVLGPMSGQPFASEMAGKPTPKDQRQRQNVPRQEDMRGAEQRSATITGAATPKDPKETLPAPRQEDHRRDEQRSATETGMATPKDKGAPAPAVRQEDARRLEQRSATRTGAAAPISDVKARESSTAKAKLGEPVSASAQGAGRAKTTRQEAARKAAATRSRNRRAAAKKKSK